MASDNKKVGSFREHKRRDSSSSEESVAFHTPPTSGRNSRTAFAPQDPFSSPTARLMARTSALSLEETKLAGMPLARAAQKAKAASSVGASKVGMKTPAPAATLLSNAISSQVPTQNAPRKDAKGKKPRGIIEANAPRKREDEREPEICLSGSTIARASEKNQTPATTKFDPTKFTTPSPKVKAFDASAYLNQNWATGLRASDTVVQEKPHVEGETVTPKAKDGFSVKDFVMQVRADDVGEAGDDHVSVLPTGKHAREAVYHKIGVEAGKAVHGTGKAAPTASSKTDNADPKTTMDVETKPKDVRSASPLSAFARAGALYGHPLSPPPTAEDKLREYKRESEANASKVPPVTKSTGSGKLDLRTEKQTPILVKADEMRDRRHSLYSPRSPTPTHDGITGKPLSRHRKRSPAPPVLTTATNQAEFEAGLESAMATGLDAISDDEDGNKHVPRLMPLSPQKNQRGRLDSDTLSLSGKKDTTEGLLRATSEGRLVDEDTGDWLFLETPPHDAEDRQLRAPSTKDASPTIGLAEAKNGATGLDDPRTRKPVSRVLKNWWTGSSRPPAEVKREPRDELLAQLRERKKANVMSADKQIIETLKKYHAKAIKEAFGDDWVAHAHIEPKVRRAIEDFVLNLEEERVQAKADAGKDEDGGAS